MSNKLRFLVSLAISFIALIVTPQAALAYTYHTVDHDTGSPAWIFIPIIIVVVAFLGLAIYQRRRAAKEASAGAVKVTSIVQEKLAAGENVLRQLNNGKADFVATDKRLLRFSGKGFEEISYTDIAAVNYSGSTGKKVAARIVVGLCLLVMIGITIGVWAMAFSSSVRNVSTLDAVIVTVVAVGLGFMGVLAMSRDFGSYQIQIKQGVVSNAGSWRIIRPPAYFGNANVDVFIKIVKDHIVP